MRNRIYEYVEKTGGKFRDSLMKHNDKCIRPFPEKKVFNTEKIGPVVGVYLHFPFCRQACSFCSFSIEPGLSRDPNGKVNTKADRYVRALLQQIERVGEQLNNGQREVAWIYLGGGTPSAMTDGQLQMLMNALHKAWKIRPGAIQTIESNVDHIIPDRLQIYSENGFNRISIGVQSLSWEERRSMGRSQTIPQVIEKLLSLKGWNYNVDVILAGPNQTLSAAEETFRILLGEIQPPQVTPYPHMRLQGTPDAKRNPKPWLQEMRDKWPFLKLMLELMNEYGYVQTDALLFSRPDMLASAPYDVSVITNGAEVIGLGQSAFSILPHLVAVNPYTTRAFTEYEEQKKEMEYLGRNDLIVRSIRSLALKLSQLLVLVPKSEQSTILHMLFLIELFRLSRDWHTTSRMVGFQTAHPSKTIPKNTRYQ